jgi:hypothetical protein
LDESAGTRVLQKAEAALGDITKSRNFPLGPFDATCSITAFFSNGTLRFSPPNVVNADGVRINFTIDLSFSVNFSDFLPDFCLPQVCWNPPWGGQICTPGFCVKWPTLTIPVHYPPGGGTDHADFSAIFLVIAYPQGGSWLVDLLVQGVPFLQLSPSASALLVAIGAAIAAIVSPIPILGVLAGTAASVICDVIALAGVLGLLGPLASLLLAGMRFHILNQSQRFQLIPTGSAVEPPVYLSILGLNTSVVASQDKNELVVIADLDL